MQISRVALLIYFPTSHGWLHPCPEDSHSYCSAGGKRMESQCSFDSIWVKDVGHFTMYMLATWIFLLASDSLPLRGDWAGILHCALWCWVAFLGISKCHGSLCDFWCSSNLPFFVNGVCPVLPQLIHQLLTTPRSQVLFSTSYLC